MNIFDTGYTLEGGTLYLARRKGFADIARAIRALHDGERGSAERLSRTSFALDEELEALLTGALPSEVEG